jgi:hypothetical protein
MLFKKKGEKIPLFILLSCRITQIVMERSLRPWLDSDLLFNLSALGRENQQCVKVLHDFTNQVIRDRKKTLNFNNNQSESVAGDDVKSQPENSPSIKTFSFFY